jgi:hypothetical protein
LALCGLLFVTGCTGSAAGLRAAGEIDEEMQRADGIRRFSAPREAQAIMGRGPDAVEERDGQTVHYYRLRGAVRGEMLELIYRNGQLLAKRVIGPGS